MKRVYINRVVGSHCDANNHRIYSTSMVLNIIYVYFVCLHENYYWIY